MNVSKRWMVRSYPKAWRSRYGDELEQLIADSADSRLSLKNTLNVVMAGTRERLVQSGLIGDGRPRDDRSRAGILLVLGAWMMFVVAGIIVQKTSEHWRAVTPAGDQGLPGGAFTLLVVAGAAGATLVIGGAMLLLPALRRFVGAGGWSEIRRNVLGALAVTVAAAAALGGLVIWANDLSAQARNGGNAEYSSAFVATGLVIVGVLAAWTGVAIAVIRRLDIKSERLRALAWLAAGTTLAISIGTVACGVWWIALADVAPELFGGGPARAPTSGSALAPQLAVAGLLMVAATVLGLVGSTTGLSLVG